MPENKKAEPIPAHLIDVRYEIGLLFMYRGDPDLEAVGKRLMRDAIEKGWTWKSYVERKRLIDEDYEAGLVLMLLGDPDLGAVGKGLMRDAIGKGWTWKSYVERKLRENKKAEPIPMDIIDQDYEIGLALMILNDDCLSIVGKELMRDAIDRGWTWEGYVQRKQQAQS